MVDLERFWAKVDKTGECWMWLGAKDKHGYGRAYRGLPKTAPNCFAHRVAYEVAYGPIPPDMNICHICDTPSCVRPDHLFCGTQADNIRDMVSKGRHWMNGAPDFRGEKSAQAKVTAVQVIAIRERYIPGVFGCRRLAAEYGLGKDQILNIVRGRSWTC